MFDCVNFLWFLSSRCSTSTETSSSQSPHPPMPMEVTPSDDQGQGHLQTSQEQVLSSSEGEAQKKELETALDPSPETCPDSKTPDSTNIQTPECSSVKTLTSVQLQQKDSSQAESGSTDSCEPKELQEGQEIYIQTEGLTVQMAEPGLDRIVIVNGPDGTTMHIQTPEGVPLEAVQALLGIEASDEAKSSSVNPDQNPNWSGLSQNKTWPEPQHTERGCFFESHPFKWPGPKHPHPESIRIHKSEGKKRNRLRVPVSQCSWGRSMNTLLSVCPVGVRMWLSRQKQLTCLQTGVRCLSEVIILRSSHWLTLTWQHDQCNQINNSLSAEHEQILNINICPLWAPVLSRTDDLWCQFWLVPQFSAVMMSALVFKECDWSFFSPVFPYLFIDKRKSDQLFICR